MNPLISVIIPVYNMEAYLARCLDSVLNSTYQNLEILCVDDGSRDRSLGILREYEAKDRRIVVIAKENGGVSSARNAGLDRVRGEFVTFIDPDDFIHPQMFALMAAAQEASGAELVIGRHQTWSEPETPAFPTFDFSKDKLAAQNALFVCKDHQLGSYCLGRLFRAELIGQLRFREDRA